MAREGINIFAGFDLKAFSTSAQNLERKLKKTGRNLKKTGKNLARSLTAPAVALGGLAVREFAMFEQSMAKVQAVSGATAKQLGELTDLSKQLGLTTRFTASEVANLELNYAKLGFSVDEIKQITEATLQLALATGEDLAQSAEVAGQTLRGFNLDASEMQRVVDLMANSFSSSALNLERFSVSMGKIAPVANAAGVSLEKTVALQSALVDSGVEASIAGTSLRRIFVELATGGLSYNEAMEKIRNSSNKVTTATELFGKRAFAAAIILSDQGDKVAELTEKYEKSGGAAKKMADIMDKTLQGSLFKLKSAVEGLAISFGEKLAPFVLKVADKAASLAKKFSGLSSETKTLIIKISGFLAILGPVLLTLGLLSTLMASIVAGPVVALIAGLAALVVGLGLYNTELSNSVKETVKLSVSQQILADSTEEYVRQVKNEEDELKSLFKELKKTKKGTKERNDLLAFANKIYGTTLKNIKDEGTFIKQLDTAYTDLVKSMKKKIVIQLQEDKLAPLIAEQISLQETQDGLYRRLEDSSGDAGEGAFDSWRTITAAIAENTGMMGDNLAAQDKLLSGDLFKEPPPIKTTNELFGLGDAADEAKDKVLALVGKLKFDATPLKTFTDDLKEFSEGLPEIKLKTSVDLDDFKNSTNSFRTELELLAADAAAKAKVIGDSISDSIKSGLQSLATESLSVLSQFLGQALAGNEDALENLGQGLLNAVGGFMTQFGEAMIALGLAQSALGTAISLGPAGAPLAIAAGIALVAAGSAISALSKQGVEGGSGVSPGGFASSSSGGVGFETGTIVQEVRISGRDLILVEQRERRLKR